jgi:coproporphyrinogen III oxidase
MGGMSDTFRDRVASYFRDLQDRIVAALEGLDGARFREDTWEREGGGGEESEVDRKTHGSEIEHVCHLRLSR